MICQRTNFDDRGSLGQSKKDDHLILQMLVHTSPMIQIPHEFPRSLLPNRLRLLLLRAHRRPTNQTPPVRLGPQQDASTSADDVLVALAHGRERDLVRRNPALQEYATGAGYHTLRDPQGQPPHAGLAPDRVHRPARRQHDRGERARDGGHRAQHGAAPLGVIPPPAHGERRREAKVAREEREEDGLRVVDLRGERGVGAAMEREDGRRSFFGRRRVGGTVLGRRGEQEAGKGYLEEERRRACSTWVCCERFGEVDRTGAEVDRCGTNLYAHGFCRTDRCCEVDACEVHWACGECESRRKGDNVPASCCLRRPGG